MDIRERRRIKLLEHIRRLPGVVAVAVRVRGEIVVAMRRARAAR